MADKTAIEWADSSWPIVTGCSPVSEGCAHCYAARFASARLKNHRHYKGLAVRGKWTGEARFNADILAQPLHWRKPRAIFVASTGDLFHEGVTDEQLHQAFGVMSYAAQHAYLVLTKRIERAAEYLSQEGLLHEWVDAARQVVAERLLQRHVKYTEPVYPQPHIWLGVSVENQARLDERLSFLLSTPAARRFLSLEPTLGPIIIPDTVVAGLGGCDGIWCDPLRANNSNAINWVILGGESGPGARPLHPQWARDTRDQCVAAQVPYFHKQNGMFTQVRKSELCTMRGIIPHPTGCYVFPEGGYSQENAHGDDHGHGIAMRRIGKKRAGRLLDGREWNEFPGEFPQPQKGVGDDG